MSKTIERRRAAGLCQKCGQRAAITGRTCCAKCLKAQAESLKKRYRKRIANGLCGICGKEPIAKGFNTCAKCLQGMKELRELRLKNGLCAYCGNEEIVEGITSCPTCREKHNKWKAAQEARLRETKKQEAI